ncbi:MAG: hypothetical protein DRI24_08360 [Deltaproteobacteria bacterium]|nr:MAG: hypothetical protein DRI24_08360 [Deltaproteobacteria bacterium]
MSNKTAIEAIVEVFDVYPVISFEDIMVHTGLGRKTLSARLSEMQDTHYITVYKHGGKGTSSIYEYSGIKGADKSNAVYMLERCFHLVKAISICTSEHVESLLEISAEDAKALMVNTANRYSNVISQEITLTIINDTLAGLRTTCPRKEMVDAYHYTMLYEKCTPGDLASVLNVSKQEAVEVMRLTADYFDDHISLNHRLIVK